MASDAISLIRRLHQHRAWVNHLLLDSAVALPVEDLRRPLPIGQGSVWKTLLHMYAAEFVWLEALLGNKTALAPGDVAGKLPGNQEGEGAVASLRELKARWAELDARWSAYLSALKPEQLDQLVAKVSSSRGIESKLRASDILLHVCTHAQYTTAQAINMLRQLGAASLPDVMLISLARQEAGQD
jgi:uncharacterized damage-inducible protein DinB